MRGARAAVWAVWVAGCGLAYSPSAFVGTMPESAFTAHTGCLDVSVAPVRMPRAPVDWPVFAYQVGNRCLHPVAVDLSRVEAHGDVGGRLVALRAHDPRGELRAGVLDGRRYLDEQIVYELVDADDAPTLGRVCLSLAELTSGAPSDPVCFDRPPERWPEDDEERFDEEEDEHEDEASDDGPEASTEEDP